jgi:hypothetical protein
MKYLHLLTEDLAAAASGFVDPESAAVVHADGEGAAISAC